MSSLPLVSCIMPTCNRRPFVARALAYFARQDYPAAELLVVDDGADPVGDLVPDDPRIRYSYLPRPMNIGDKRNLACEQARGLIIAEWDDDDWYGPHRLRHQVAPLLAGEADMTGLVTTMLDLERWQGWAIAPELHRQMFVGDVHGGTLVFWRWVWERLAVYPSVHLAEDVVFQLNARRRGALLRRLPNAGSFVYVRHGRNSWQFVAGTHGDPAGWQALPPEALIPHADLEFYAAHRAPQPATPRPARPPGEATGPHPFDSAQGRPLTPAPASGLMGGQNTRASDRFSASGRATGPHPLTPAPARGREGTPPLSPRGGGETREHGAVAGLWSLVPGPWSELAKDLSPAQLVTCIMTSCTRATLPWAIACFQAQDYPERELLIVDDGAESLAELVPADPAVRYLHVGRPLVAGQRRNLACELARGPLIAHWDGAAWAPPDRLSAQAAALAAHGAELCGSDRCLAYAPRTGQAWAYAYPAGRRRFWAAGGSLLYHRGVWQRRPFEELDAGEETRFLWEAEARKIALPELLWAVTLLAGASSGLPPPGLPWQPCPPEAVPGTLVASCAPVG